MNKIKNNVKYFSKLPFTFILNLLKIYSIGIVFTIFFIISGAFILIQKTGSIGHSGSYLFLLASFSVKPFSTILYIVLIFFSVFFIPSFAMKYSISRVICKIITDKSKSYLNPILDKVFDKYRNLQPNIIRNSGDFVLDKAKLIHQVENETETNLVKRIIVFAIKKIKLEELIPADPNTNIYDFMKEKIIAKLHDLTETSMLSLFILIGSQWIVLGVIYFIKW